VCSPAQELGLARCCLMWCAVVFSDVMLGCVRAGDARECYAREGTRCSRACDCGRGGAGGKGSRLGNTGSQIVSIEMCNCMVTVLDTLESAGLEHVLFRMCARNPPDNRQPWLISHAAKPACSVSHGRGGRTKEGFHTQPQAAGRSIRPQNALG